MWERQYPLPGFPQVGTARSKQAAAEAPWDFTTGCSTWVQRHQHASFNSAAPPQAHSWGGSPVHPKGAAPTLGNRDKRPTGTPPFNSSKRWSISWIPITAEGPNLLCAVEVDCALHPSFPGSPWSHFATVWILSLLLPLRPLFLFPESPVLFSLCCGKENAITIKVQNRDRTSTHFSPNQVHREGDNCTVRRDIAFSHATVLPGLAGENTAAHRFPTQPAPATGTPHTDCVPRLLRKQG